MGLFFRVFIFYFCTWFGCVRPMWQVAEVELMRNISNGFGSVIPVRCAHHNSAFAYQAGTWRKKILISTSTEKCNVRDAHETKIHSEEANCAESGTSATSAASTVCKPPNLKGQWCILLLAFAADTMTSTSGTKHFTNLYIYELMTTFSILGIQCKLFRALIIRGSVMRLDKKLLTMHPQTPRLLATISYETLRPLHHHMRQVLYEVSTSGLLHLVILYASEPPTRLSERSVNNFANHQKVSL